ncbi:hypothetical protein TWF481_006754 [Arthrobotrys musiformis]|uniref:Uncharacterized protein n=1 Tax=Arthrobotrys musiformis TaxID=47236 RepID=A0AAV9WBB6_9PEZI
MESPPADIPLFEVPPPGIPPFEVPPPEGTLPEEIDDDQPKEQPQDPGFNKIHTIIGGQLNGLFNGSRLPGGEVTDFPNVSSQTAQQVINWYKRKAFYFNLYNIRYTTSPSHII